MTENIMIKMALHLFLWGWLMLSRKFVGFEVTVIFGIAYILSILIFE